MPFRNRMHNITNPYQGDVKKVLCVCSAGLLRSPTTAHVLNQKFGYNTRAVGVNSDYALIPIDIVHISWADEIVCMDIVQKAAIENIVKESQMDPNFINIKVLNIPDRFSYMDEELVDMILESYTKD